MGGGGAAQKKARPGQAPWTIVNILKRRRSRKRKRRSRRWSRSRRWRRRSRRWRRRSRVTGSQGARGRVERVRTRVGSMKRATNPCR